LVETVQHGLSCCMRIQGEKSQPNKKVLEMLPEQIVDNGFIKTSFVEST
jgi:hypothetical protein